MEEAVFLKADIFKIGNKLFVINNLAKSVEFKKLVFSKVYSLSEIDTI